MDTTIIKSLLEYILTEAQDVPLIHRENALKAYTEMIRSKNSEKISSRTYWIGQYEVIESIYNEIRSYLDQSNKVWALKVFRDYTKCSLNYAIDALEKTFKVKIRP